jgi:hypothetical protein
MNVKGAFKTTGIIVAAALVSVGIQVAWAAMQGSQVLNDSLVSGTTVKDALNTIFGYFATPKAATNQTTVTNNLDGTWSFGLATNAVLPGSPSAQTSLASPILQLTGNVSKNAPGSNGYALDGSPSPTFTDTTGNSTVTNEVGYSFPQATLTSLSSVTATRAADVYIPIANCTAPLTCTSKLSLVTGGGILLLGGTFQGPTLGVTDGSAASSILVGAHATIYIDSTGAVALTTATSADVTSVSLTAGSYEITGSVFFTGTSSSVNYCAAWSGLSSASLPTHQYYNVFDARSGPLYSDPSTNIPIRFMDINATTTVYLSAQCTFGSGTVSAYGTINWLRVR